MTTVTQQNTQQETPRVVDMGTVTRDLQGQFAKIYTLSYVTRSRDVGDIVQIVRHLPASGVELVGRVVNRAADRGLVWDIAVGDASGTDVTGDFACFGDDTRADSDHAWLGVGCQVVGCQVAGCTNQATSTIYACGMVYLCDECRAQIDQLTAERIAESA